MSNSLPQLYSYKGQSWDTYLKDMKVTTSQILIDSKDNEESGNVRLLPRKDINIYGTCPKMEVFKLMKCNSCNKMLLPSVFKSHREKFHSGTKLKVPGTNTTLTSTSSSSTVVKKKESRIKEKKKKTQTPSVPPRPLFPKSPTAPSPTIIANSVEALQLTSPLLETVTTDQIKSQSSQTTMSQKVSDKLNESTSPSICSITSPPSTTSTSAPVSIVSTTSSALSVSSSSTSLPTVSPPSNATLSNNSSFNVSKGCKITASNVLLSISSTTTTIGKHKYFQKSKTPRDSSDADKQSVGTDGTKGPGIRSSPSTNQQSPAKRIAEMNSDPKDITTLATSTGVTVPTTTSATCASPLVEAPTYPLILPDPDSDIEEEWLNESDTKKTGYYVEVSSPRQLDAICLPCYVVIERMNPVELKRLSEKMKVSGTARSSCHVVIERMKTANLKRVSEKMKASEIMKNVKECKILLKKSMVISVNDGRKYKRKYPRLASIKNLTVRIPRVVVQSLRRKLPKRVSPIVGTSAALPALTVPLTTQRVLLTIPGHLSAIQMYSCHPKPLSMPTPVTRRVGGSFILRNQRLEKQKNEIEMAKCNMISSPSYKTFSVLNMHHKPNILKNNPRGSNKIQGIKRTTNDKILSLEHKQSRITSDVNGFIIHADVSESATPQNNNCLQKKLAICNMK